MPLFLYYQYRFAATLCYLNIDRKVGYAGYLDIN